MELSLDWATVWTALWQAALLSLTLHWVYVISRQYLLPGKMIGPSFPLPFFSHSLHFFFEAGFDFRRLHIALYNLQRNAGFPKLERFWLGVRQIVMLNDLDGFKTILGRKYKLYDRSQPEHNIAFVRGGLITALNGKKWRQDRGMLAHHFDHASLAIHIETVLDRVNAAISAMDRSIAASSVNNSAVINMKTVIFRMTFDVICRITFGRHFRSLEDQALDSPDPPMLEAFERCLVEANKRFHLFWIPYWKLPGSQYLFKHVRQFIEAEQCILTSIDEEIRKADKVVRSEQVGVDQNSSTLNYMLHKRYNDKVDLSDHDIQRQLVTFLFAGHDTTVRRLLFRQT